LIENYSQPLERIKLEGIFRYHNNNCINLGNCYCSTIIKDDIKAEGMNLLIIILKLILTFNEPLITSFNIISIAIHAIAAGFI
jgi:hypothetical protein